MADLRRYDPSQERDPDGKFGDGVPGPAVHSFDMAGFDNVIEIEGTFGDLAMGVDDTGDVRLAFRESGKVREFDLGSDEVAELGDALDELTDARADLPDDADTHAVYDDRGFGDGDAHRAELYGSGVIVVTFGHADDDPYTLTLDPPDDGDEDSEASDDVAALIEAIDEVLQGGLVDDTGATRSFQPEEHPRAPAGSDTGGQFATGGGGQKKATPKRQPKRRPTSSAASGTLAYDPSSGQGTGYDSKDGDPRVHDLQRALTRLGIKDSSGKPLRDDGQLGPKTTSAVKALQKRLGLEPDGKVTPALLAQIKSMKSLPAKRSAFMDVCVRAFDFEFESRSRSGDGRTLEGYAAVFNSPTRIAAVGGDFDEVISPGAFARSIRSRMPVLQFEHGRDPRVGAVPIGSIEDLSEDSQGLHVRATLFDNPVVEPVRQAIAGQAIKGMSFRFNVVDGGDQWQRRSGAIDLRTVGDADVHELGPVVFPAYDTTTVSVRSLLAQLGPEEHRTLLRELAYDLRSLEPEDIAGRPTARSSGGGDTDKDDGPTEEHLSIRQRLDHGALRTRGILK